MLLGGSIADTCSKASEAGVSGEDGEKRRGRILQGTVGHAKKFMLHARVRESKSRR